MSATLLKISDAHLTAVGAKSQDEFISKVVELCTSANTAASATTKAIEGLAAPMASLAEGIKGNTTSIGQITNALSLITEKLGNPELMTEAKIKEIAASAGSAKAAEALGATGITPPAPPSAAAKVGAESANAVQSLIKAGKFKEAFEADANIKAEFGEVGVFVSFMKAQRGGHVKLKQ